MAREEKKSRTIGLPPRLVLQEKDSITGSFPTKARSAVCDNRTGKFGVSFDDTSTMIFTSSTDSSYPPLLHFNDATFTNASERYLLDPLNKRVLGPFAAGTLAITTYQDRIYAQIEEARINEFIQSQDIGDVAWTKTRLENPVGATDPLGGSTAWKLIPTTDDDTHFAYQSITPDGSSAYVHYVIAKKGEYNWIRLALQTNGYPGTPSCYFNLNTGTEGTSVECDSTDMVDLGDGWYLCSISATSDAAAASLTLIYVSEDDGDDSFAGDGSKGIYVWNPQFEKGAFPSSPIKTVATPVTRSKDQLYWTSALVPTRILSGEWACKMSPLWAHDEEGTMQYVCAAGSGGDYLRWNGVTKKFQIYAGNVLKVQSKALTFASTTLITLTVNALAGTLRVANADTGNGKETSGSWTWPGSEDLDWGHVPASTNQINGLLSEPYGPWPAEDIFYYGQNIPKNTTTKPIFSESLGKGFFEISGGITPDNHYITASVDDTRITRAGVSDTFLLPQICVTGGQDLTPFRDHDHPAVDAKSRSNNHPFYATGSAAITFGEGLEQPLWSKSKIEIDLTPSQTHQFGIQNYLSTSKNHPMAYWNKDAKMYQGIGSGIEFDVYNNADTPISAETFTTASILFEEQTIGFAGSIAANWPISANPDEGYRGYGVTISNFHFPYHAKYHATGSNLIPMSEFIKEPFLVEKIVLEFSGTYQANNTNYTSTSLIISGAMTTFFILNQTAPTVFDLSQNIRWLHTAAGTPFFQSAIPISHSMPGTYVLSGSDSNEYLGNIPVSRSNLINTTRDLITYLQISSFDTSSEDEYRLRLLGREYNLTSSGTDKYWSRRFVVSGSPKSTIGAYPSAEVFVGLNTWHEDSDGEMYAYVETNTYGGRNGRGSISGRSLLNNYIAQTPLLYLSTGSYNAYFYESHYNENPYLLFPTDNLIIGWQTPTNNIRTNFSENIVAYEGLGPQLEFGTSPSKVILYGSLLRENKEYHDTLNQLLSSNVIHEEVE